LPIFPVSLSPNSPAGRCGQLRVGDCVVAINGMSADMMSHQVLNEFFDFNLYLLKQMQQEISSSGASLVLTIDPAKRIEDEDGISGNSNRNTSNYIQMGGGNGIQQLQKQNVKNFFIFNRKRRRQNFSRNYSTEFWLKE